MAHPVTTAVSFAKVPLDTIGEVISALMLHGWRWDANDVDWIAHFHKDFSDEEAASVAESEIREVMGAYHVSAEEIARRAEELWEQMSKVRSG